MAKLVTFGETMIRLSVPLGKRLENTQTLDVTVGGSEMNVAIGAARLGLSARWVHDFLPTDGAVISLMPVGSTVWIHSMWSGIPQAGVVPTLSSRSPPDRLRYFMIEPTLPFANLRLGEIDWSRALDGAEVFLTSGITTAVCGLDITLEAITAAKEAGVKVAFDLNYRSKLWDVPQAREAYRKILPLADILFASGSDAQTFSLKKGIPWKSCW